MSANPRVSNSSRYNRFVSKVKARGDACAICWHAIDYSLPSGDPMAFEADHIVPVSDGGPLYDPANGQAAHRCCNNWRKDKPMQYVDDVMAGVVKPRTPPPIWREGEPANRNRRQVVPTFDW